MISASPTTSDAKGQMFGTHIPELQLDADDYRDAFRVAGLQSGMTYVELGSGHGNGLVIAAEEFGAVSRGVEYLPDAIDTAMSLADKRGVSDRVAVERGDLQLANIDDADVLYIYLGPAFHDILAGRIERCVSPETIVLAAGWRVPGWLPVSEHLDAWSAGYVYRPASPDMQISWGESGVVGSDSVQVATSHACLNELTAEIQLVESGETILATVANGETSGASISVGRGEPFLIGWPSAMGKAQNLTISAVCSKGIRTQRGTTFTARVG